MARETNDALVARIQALAESPRLKLADLLPFTDHEDSSVRVAAFRALWNIPCDGALQASLRAIRTDPELEVQTAAVSSLGRYIWSGMQLDESLEDQFGFEADVSAADVKRSRQELHALRGDAGKPEAIRLAALEALAYDADDAVSDEIGALWQDADVTRKALALRCMGRTGQARWRPVVLETLHASDPALLLAAIDAAGEGCMEDAETRLLDLTVSSDRAVALAAIWALRNVIHTAAGRKSLERLARGKDPEIKAKARAAIQDLDAMDVEERGEDNDDD